MERWRRVALIAGLAGGLWLVFWAFPRPLVTVSAFDPAAERESYRAELAFGFPSEEDRRLAALTLEDFQQEMTLGRTVEVEGGDWAAFFGEMGAASREQRVPPKWASRVGPGSGWSNSSPRTIWRRPSEGPLPEVAETLKERGELFVALQDGGALLKLQWKPYSSDDFRLGSGFKPHPVPPSALIYPLRPWAWAAWLGGLALYLVLPRRKVEAGELAYPLWRVMLGDFLGAMLFFLFFVIPFLVIGGSVQVLTKAWMFPPIFWTLSAGGVWILLWSAKWERWRVGVKEGGLLLPGPAGPAFYPFAKMAYLQRIVLRPPKWLVIASWAAAASGRGAAQIGAAGRAAILTGTGYQALGIGLEGGGVVHLWLTDQAGTPLVPGLERVFEALDAAGVPRKEEALTLERISLPPSAPPPA